LLSSYFRKVSQEEEHMPATQQVSEEMLRALTEKFFIEMNNGCYMPPKAIEAEKKRIRGILEDVLTKKPGKKQSAKR
jgi:hypothetical protein